MNKRKDVLTTGQVAEICKVAPRTVTKWFDTGQLKGYRIPGSKDRRIPASELIRFMKSHDMPTDALDIGKMRVLIIDSNYESAELLATALKNRKSYEVRTAQNSFEAGMLAQKLNPHAIMINIMSKDISTEQVCKLLRANGDLNGSKIIAIAEGLSESQAPTLQKKGFDQAITDVSDVNYVARVLETATSHIF